ncbi:hypothetical protein [uncultured Corynebacterium sp.]|uniref:hypothetical protein n=1 Tax=uncultured Corynebacterium sp. TaxID=159447 RepID=UPI0025E32C9C|nr:hypothetical protein [uncultured Corynebacterium sp.]
MANPAQLLLDIFNKWNEESSSAKISRGDDDLTEHMRAAQLIEQIGELLDRLDSTGGQTEVYRRYLPQWRRILFCYPNSWGTIGSAAIPQTPRDHLSTLAFMLRDIITAPQADKVESLRSYLDVIIEELTQDGSLPASVKDSAFTVINHMRCCIDDLEVLGDFAFEQSYERLLGALAIISLKSDDKSRWKRVFDNFVYPYAVNNLPSLSSAGNTIRELFSPGA